MKLPLYRGQVIFDSFCHMKAVQSLIPVPEELDAVVRF